MKLKSIKRPGYFKRKFGVDEYGFVDLPRKISGTFVDRVYIITGCDFCFPHGFEAIHPRQRNCQRSWKEHRKTQYKAKRY